MPRQLRWGSSSDDQENNIGTIAAKKTQHITSKVSSFGLLFLATKKMSYSIPICPKFRDKNKNKTCSKHDRNLS